jgi:hypothetical protein
MFFSIGCTSSTAIHSSDPAKDAMRNANGEWRCERHPFVPERSTAHVVTFTQAGRAAVVCVEAEEENECYCLLPRPFPIYDVYRVPEHGRITALHGPMCGDSPILGTVELAVGPNSISVSDISTRDKLDCTRGQPT